MNTVVPGAVYKDRRGHPGAIFMVTEVKRVKKGTTRDFRVYGLRVDQGGTPQEDNLLSGEFGQAFPFSLWVP